MKKIYEYASYIYKAKEYGKSLIYSEDKLQNTTWTAGFLFFLIEQKTYILDKAFILVGDIPRYYYQHFLNFSNWIFKDDKMYYILSDEDKEIVLKNHPKYFAEHFNGIGLEVNPKCIHLHIKICTTKNFIDFSRIPSYWNFYVSHPNDNLYKQLVEQIKKKVKLINCVGIKNNHPYTIKDIENPLFERYQYYGDIGEEALFSSVDITMFSSIDNKEKRIELR